MNYVWGTGTHVGRVREGNEDSLYPKSSGSSNGPVILMVADGMGGAVAGEVASGIAVDTASAADAADSISLEDRVLAANEAVGRAVEADPSLAGMGTTLTIVRLNEDGTMNLAHVGDSRAYLFRNDEMEQLTVDHTLVNELIELGRITPEEAERHPHRHLITRVLGLGPVGIDSQLLTLEDGDRILLCLGPHLFIVKKADGRIVTKSRSGFEFGDYRKNWKLQARIFVRKTKQQYREIYTEMTHADPQWMELREFYDPLDGTLLDIETVPPGYPLTHSFEPDLDTFYTQWLGRSYRNDD